MDTVHMATTTAPAVVPPSQHQSIVIPDVTQEGVAEKRPVLLPPLPDIHQSTQYIEVYIKKALDRGAFEPLYTTSAATPAPAPSPQPPAPPAAAVIVTEPVAEQQHYAEAMAQGWKPFAMLSSPSSADSSPAATSSSSSSFSLALTAATSAARSPMSPVHLPTTPTTTNTDNNRRRLGLDPGGAHVPIEKRRKHRCQTCDKGFTTSGHLARHNRIHTGEKNHRCHFPGCGQRFSRHDNCLQHYRTHLKKTSNPAVKFT
ncbi:C2H2-type zinc finger protein Ecym_2654 [Eremothecium cymbalariae DBVPG|uniref:C2H2-type domain-containing protein n=1 Tax=Eremothecium cymbalariae (strain CBS 270.75 / DBVPG 7215 / KCTC 17166 / NRRL Y-17582) TaxID=931890 RepID=G8JNU0_ERECY|nr:Hypothetical protein Ecym_2654 [Eremothecium cymbalariae DBVPG\